jgi:CheY-like chemotaxis protein
MPNDYRPILARDGAEAVRIALSEIPDLIILDQDLPKMSGSDVLEGLCTRSLQVPAILMTSRGAQTIDIRLLRLGVRDFLVKPFSVDQLLQSIRQVTFEVQLRREKAALTHRLGQAELKIRQCLIEFGIFHKIGEGVIQRMPLDDLLERIIDAALHITQSEECVLVLNDPETGERTEKFRKRRIRGFARPLVPYTPPKSGQPGTVVAMLHIPLKMGSQEIGVLGVNNKTALRSFNNHERQTLSILANYAAIAIRTAQLFHQVEGLEQMKE